MTFRIYEFTFALFSLLSMKECHQLITILYWFLLQSFNRFWKKFNLHVLTLRILIIAKVNMYLLSCYFYREVPGIWEFLLYWLFYFRKELLTKSFFLFEFFNFNKSIPFDETYKIKVSRLYDVDYTLSRSQDYLAW